MSDTEPIRLRPLAWRAVPTGTDGGPRGAQTAASGATVLFDRRELDLILAAYGRKVATGEWRDYAIDFGDDRAVFSIFRRASEVPILRIEKEPRLARRQGAYRVVAATGWIMKRGNDLARVLEVLDQRVRLVEG